MRRKLPCFVFVFIAVLALSCGSGRGDPISSGQNATDYGGSLSLGSGRVNTPVSESSKMQICQILNTELYGLYLKTMSGIANTPQKVDSLPVTRISGAYSGYFQAMGRKELREDNKTVDFDFLVTLHDFSDSGLVFMGGKLNVRGYVVNEDLDRTTKLIISGGLLFAGDYAGAVEYHSMRMPINTCNNLSSIDAHYFELERFTIEGSQTLIYGDTRIRFNPYFREYDPLDTIVPPCFAY